jgi:diketogulonate reductase-like aldo/keto reductase
MSRIHFRPKHHTPTRRIVLKGFIASAALPPTLLSSSQASSAEPATPSTAYDLPSIGLGSWITFNVGQSTTGLARSRQVIELFVKNGGKLIDSSPMYGSSQETIGHALSNLKSGQKIFAADKVWTRSRRGAAAQIEETRAKWGIPSFDLLQVHNLLAWEAHLETLFAMKAAGHLRYVGVTTSHGRRHSELENILKTEPIDFVQFTYNIQNREVENRLLPLAKERGIAVICNRPFGGGSIIARANRRPLPTVAKDLGINSWASYLLRFIISHPSVTCAIPATSDPAHLVENMSALHGQALSQADRQKMVKEFYAS